MVDWKDAIPQLVDNTWKYLVFDDFEGENFNYIRKHYKSLLAGSNDKITVTDKYLKKVSIQMQFRPSVIILNQEPCWNGLDYDWIEQNTVTYHVTNSLIN